MIAKEVASAGIAALSACIVQILEDNHELAFAAVGTEANALRQAAKFLEVGRDIRALASALEVLGRTLAEDP